jgi:hypothetical protein
MNAFLILSSLSVPFYLAVLRALYRDGRKQRSRAGPVRKLDLRTDVALGTAPATGSPSIVARRGGSPEGVLWVPVTTPNWKVPLRTTSGNPAKQVHLAARVGGEDDLQCG